MSNENVLLENHKYFVKGLVVYYEKGNVRKGKVHLREPKRNDFENYKGTCTWVPPTDWGGESGGVTAGGAPSPVCVGRVRGL